MPEGVHVRKIQLDGGRHPHPGSQVLLGLVEVAGPQQGSPSVPADHGLVRRRRHDTRRDSRQQLLGARRRVDDRSGVAPDARGGHLHQPDARQNRGAVITFVGSDQAGRLRCAACHGRLIPQVETPDGRPEANPGVRVDLGFRQSLQQAGQGLAVRAEDVRKGRAGDQRVRELPVLRLDRVPKRLHGLPPLTQPRRCRPVRRRHDRRRTQQELVPQRFPEQVVVAIPDPVHPDTDDESIRPLQRFQHAAGHRADR